MGQTKRNQKWAYVFYIWACIVRTCGLAGVRACDLLCYCLWCCTQEMKIFPFCFMGTQDCHRMYVLADPCLFNLSTRGVTSRRGRLTSLMVIGRDYRAPTGGGSSDRGIRYWTRQLLSGGCPAHIGSGGPAGLNESPHQLYRYQEARCGLLSHVAYWYSAFGSVPV